MSDLLQAAGYAAIVYLLFNYLISFGSGRPLVEWINPGRQYLPILALTLIGGAYGSLRIAALRNPGTTQLQLLHKLVSEEKAPAEVVGAMSLVVFAASILLLFGYCWLKLPRAAQTFNPNPHNLVDEYRRAIRHYVRWSGGLDFAILCEIRNGELTVVAEGGDDKDIQRGLNRLPGLHTEANSKNVKADVQMQKQIWKDMALALFNKWKTLNELLYPARHGNNVALTFDLRYGAIFVEMIEEEPAPPGGDAVGIFLFGAALNQHEVNTLMATRHFTTLSQAIRHIRTGVIKG
ncbi:MAG: hypothetical protein ACRC8S_02480 [Fimbriiglobus sp.]